MKFSVLMSVYKNDEPDYLKKSLESLTKQSKVPQEIVLVFDGPLGPKLLRVIEDFDSKFTGLLKCIRLETNAGLGNALNIGLAKCSFELVARMDADDISTFDRFEIQLNEFEKDINLDILGSYVNDIDDKGTVLNIRKVPQSNSDIRKLLWSCPIIHPTVMFKKRRIMKSGSYDIKLKRRQDYDLWFRCMKNDLVFKNLDTPLLNYRVDENTYQKKNNFSVQLQQYKIGIRGSLANKLGLVAIIGITGNFILKIQPSLVQKYLNRILRNFDPRV